MNSSVKTIMFWLFILICLVLLWGVVERSTNMGKEPEYAYSDLYDKVVNNQVLDAAIQGDELKGHLKVSPKDEFHTTLPSNYEDLLKAMIASKVNFSIKEPQNNVPDSPAHQCGPVRAADCRVVLHAAANAVGRQ